MLNERLEEQRDDIESLRRRIAVLTKQNEALAAVLKDARERMLGNSPAIVALRNRADEALAMPGQS